MVPSVDIIVTIYKEYDDMRTCQMDAMSSEVFDKALALGWIIRGIEKRNRKSLFSYDSEGFKATKFFHSAGLCLLHGRTWGLSTSKEGLFPVRDICSMAAQIRINRVLSPPGSVFHMLRQCPDAARIFPR